MDRNGPIIALGVGMFLFAPAASRLFSLLPRVSDTVAWWMLAGAGLLVLLAIVVNLIPEEWLDDDYCHAHENRCKR
jgi:uncharacterized membrane protein SirB2